MKNLNIEFWNEVEILYPDAVQAFKIFIDDYKETVGWRKLFNEGAILHDGNAVAPKFHDVPFAIQIGILMTWIATFDKGGVLHYSFIIQDGLNIEGVKFNLKLALRRIQYYVTK